MIVYKAENLINGKIYIGRTVTPIENRQWGHVNAAKKNSKTIFHNAIRKYGADNFQFSVLCQCDSYEEMNEKEKFFISSLDSQVPNGYNMTPGGDGLPKGFPSPNKGVPCSEEMKQKISNTLMGRKQSEETCLKRSESLKRAYQEGRKVSTGGKVGRKCSLEARKRIGDAKRGNKNPNFGKPNWNSGLTGIKTSNKGQIPWNAGLTKETDERVKQYAETLVNSPNSHVFKKGQKAWNEGIPTVHSEESNQKRSITMQGEKKSPETIANMKIAQRERRLKEQHVNR